MASSQRDVTKEEFWRVALARHAESGLSVRAFCREAELTESAFYAWRRTLAARDGTDRRAAKPSFLSAIVNEGVGDTSIILALASGSRLELPMMAPAKIAELVHSLETQGDA